MIIIFAKWNYCRLLIVRWLIAKCRGMQRCCNKSEFLRLRIIDNILKFSFCFRAVVVGKIQSLPVTVPDELRNWQFYRRNALQAINAVCKSKIQPDNFLLRPSLPRSIPSLPPYLFLCPYLKNLGKRLCIEGGLRRNATESGLVLSTVGFQAAADISAWSSS